MGEKLKNFGNRIGNTVMIAPRVGGTVLQSGIDTFETIVALPKDALDVASNTARNIKDVFVNSWTKGKRYQRIGNVILSPIVATGTAIEGAVRTAVTPVVNGVSNSWNTIKNTVKNGRRSTFGRIFSKRPISDFSYDKLATANIINKDKNRFSNLQFGKKKGNWTNYSTGSRTKGGDANIVGGAAAITAANIVSKHDISTLKNDFENKITEMQNKFSSQINDILSANTKLINENKSLRNDNLELKSKINELKADKDLKGKTKLEEPSKAEMKKNAKAEEKTKSSTKSDNTKDNESKINSDKKIENKDNEKSDENPGTEIKEAAREGNSYLNELVSNNDILNGICNSAIKRTGDSIEFIIDSSTNNSKLKSHKKGEGNIQIVVGSKAKNLDTNACAPMNWDPNNPNFIEKQIKHNLAHELSHLALQMDKVGSKDLLSLMQKFADDGKHLSMISQNTKKYKDNAARATEDACELFALYCNSQKDFDNYMRILSDEWNGENRNKLGVTQITKKEAESIKNACKKFANSFSKEENSEENMYKMAA